MIKLYIDAVVLEGPKNVGVIHVLNPIISGLTFSPEVQWKDVEWFRPWYQISESIMDTALNHYIKLLPEEPKINKENVPEIIIYKKTNKDFPDYANDAINELKRRGIKIYVEDYKNLHK